MKAQNFRASRDRKCFIMAPFTGSVDVCTDIRTLPWAVFLTFAAKPFFIVATEVDFT